MKSKRIRIKKILIKVAIVVIAAFCALQVADFMVDRNVYYTPEYAQVDLEEYLQGVSGKELSGDKYDVLYKQTGLGRDAVDKIFSGEDNYLEIFEMHQENFFNPKKPECREIGIITFEEKTWDENGQLSKGFVFADLRDGDILISKSTHSLGWRHGHAGIVTNAEKGETLEAVLWGMPTMFQKAAKWSSYPTMIQLRLKDANLGEELAAYAKENMEEINYGLLTGIPTKAPEKASVTQCAHLPWYAYYQFGYDIDSDGGWLVTPNDIANSKFFEVVQIYGVNPDRPW